MKEYYVCKRLRLYDWLVKHSYHPIERRTDKTNSKYFVWIFKYSNDLQECIDSYYGTF